MRRKRVKIMTDMNNCERAAEIVSYIYDEIGERARRDFAQHLKACAPCRAELAAFGEVRGAVRDWHAELLSHAPALALPAMLPEYARNGRAAHTPAAVVAPQRSALAALREFFTLTPVWLRAGMVAASLAVCALATLALVNAEFRWDGNGVAFNTHLREQVNKQPSASPSATQQVATTTNEAQFTQADMDKVVTERDAAQRELAATRERLDATQQQVNTLNASLANSKAAYRQMLAGMRVPRGGQNNGTTRYRLTNAPLMAENTDDDELRLSDLLNEVNAGRNAPQSIPNNR